MSITTFVRAKENVARLKVLQPPPPRALGVPLLVPPRSKRYGLIGTAFDYLLRFEIERWAPHARTKHWVAQSAAELFFIQEQQPDGSYRSLVPDAELAKVAMPVADESPNTVERFPIRRPGEVQHHSVVSAYKIGSRAMSIVQAAKDARQQYILQAPVGRDHHERMARHAIRLAKLDVVFRAAKVDELLLIEPENDDVQELADMLAIVPLESFAEDVLILNPTFGEASRRIGGADCDLLAGDLLVDFKTTTKASVEVVWLDQLLGYYLLARNERTRDPSFPEIKRLGLYFARHGFLWERPVSQWVDHPRFAEIEDWFAVTALSRAQDSTASGS